MRLSVFCQYLHVSGLIYQKINTCVMCFFIFLFYFILNVPIYWLHICNTICLEWWLPFTCFYCCCCFSCFVTSIDQGDVLFILQSISVINLFFYIKFSLSPWKLIFKLRVCVCVIGLGKMLFRLDLSFLSPPLCHFLYYLLFCELKWLTWSNIGSVILVSLFVRRRNVLLLL